jgi:hypothetical protein
MPRLGGIADFNPEKDIPSLNGKVVVITGGVFTLSSHFIDLTTASNTFLKEPQV